MAHDIDTTNEIRGHDLPDPDIRDRDLEYNERPLITTTPDAAYRPIVTPVTPTETVVERPSRFPAFVAGFVTAVLVAAAAFAAFLVVSDSDDDGTINVDVPAVQVGNND